MRRYAIKESTLQSIADEIRAKTGETAKIEPENMAAGVARAHEAGYKSAYDPDKVIEKTVSGGGLVFLDDVSEVRHAVRMKLSSDTITEFMNTYVRVMGKNMFDLSAYNDSATCGGVSIEYDRITQVFTLHGTCTGAATVHLPIRHSCRGMTTCRLYIERVGGIASGGGLKVGISPNYSMPTTPIVEITESTETAESTGTIDSAAYIVFNTTTAGTEYINYQFKIMVAATEQAGYEPHQCASYAVSEDGTVEVQSIAPNMTIFTNVAEVNGITVDYWRSCVYDNGYEEGSAFYNDFWDETQNNGARTDYSQAFEHSCKTDKTFRPKHDMEPTNANRMFFDSKITDLNKCLEASGTKLDFSTGKCIYFSRIFGGSAIQYAPMPLNISNCKDTNILYGASKLKEVAFTGVKETHAFDGYMFMGANSIEKLSIEGVIGRNVNVNGCSLLDAESCKGVLLALKDYSGTDYAFTYSVTFNANAWARLDALGATSPHGNNWVDYATDKGWNT